MVSPELRCGACVKKCPQQARYYDDQGYLYHKRELEEEFTRRAEPELFV
jgi:ferredoxin